MADTKISPIVNQDVVGMWNAKDADSMAVAKQTLITDAQAQLQTIPADDVADRQTLNNIIAYANGYQFDPGAPKQIPLDSDDMNLALANAYNDSGPDLVSLFEDYMTLLNQEHMAATSEVVNDTEQEGVQMDASYNDSLKSASDEQNSTLISGAGQIVNGTLQVASAGVEAGGAVKANEGHAEVESITVNEVNDTTTDEVDPQTGKPKVTKPGLRSLAKTAADKADDVQAAHAETVDSAENGATETEKQTAKGKLKQSEKDVRDSRAASRAANNDLESANSRITVAKGKAEKVTSYTHAGGTLLTGLGGTVQGITTILAGNAEQKSKGEGAAATLDSNRQSLLKQAADTAQTFSDSTTSGCGAVQQTIATVNQSRDELQKKLAS